MTNDLAADAPTEAVASVAPASGARRYYTVVVLMLAYACAILDRGVIGVALPQLKHEFRLGDADLGFLSGLAFTASFVIFGLPMAVLADRTNRRNIIAASVALWSAMTALFGLAGNLVQLALARTGVAIGEAGLSPSAQSLIADLFPHHRRGLALSIYSVGIAVGAICGLAVGGYLVQHFGWRRTFFIMAIPGLVVSAVFLLTVREPARGGSDEIGSRDLKYRNFLEVLGYLWSTESLRYTLLGITLCSLFTLSMAAWQPSFLVRTHGLTIAQAGLMLGVGTGVGGCIGTMLGGQLSDHFGARDARWRAWVPAIAFLAMPFSALVFLYSTSLPLIAVMAVINPMLAAVHVAPASAVTVNLTAQRMRARAIAVTMFLNNLVGGGLGPLMVGSLSDHLHAAAGKNSLRYALTAAALFAFAAAGSYFVAGLKMVEPRR